MAVGEKSVSLDGLKAVYDHISGEMDGIKSTVSTVSGVVDIPSDINNGYYRYENLKVTPTPNPGSGYKCNVVECQAGDVFKFTGTSYGAAARMYAFTDAEYNAIAPLATKNATMTEDSDPVVAPENAVYLFINSYQSSVTVKKGIGIQEKVSEHAERFNVIDERLEQMNSVSGFVNYGYDQPEQIGTGTVFKRNKTFLAVNGSSNKDQRLKVSGGLAIAATSSNVRDWAVGITLNEGHVYKFSYHLLSGSVTYAEGGSLPVLSVYPVGESSSIGYLRRLANGDSERRFTAPSGEVNLCFYSAANTAYTNAEYILTLEEITPNDDSASYISPVSVGLYGDSICKGTITTGTYATKNFSNYISEILGYDTTNNAVGGSGYCKRSDMNSVYDAVVSGGASFGAILLFAGTNDYGYDKPIGTLEDTPGNTTSSTFYASVKNVIEYILTQNSNCQLMLVTPIFRNYHSTGGTGNAYNIQNGAGHTLNDYCDALVNIGKYYNIPVLDSRYNSPVNFLNYADKLTETEEGSGKYLHPTDATYPILYKKIVKWMNTII